jgi:hypothetical protein
MRPETAPKDPQQLLSEDREAALVERRYAHEWQQLEDLEQRKKAADKAAFARRTVCPPVNARQSVTLSAYGAPRLTLSAVRDHSAQSMLSILRQPTSGLAGPPKP